MLFIDCSFQSPPVLNFIAFGVRKRRLPPNVDLITAFTSPLYVRLAEWFLFPRFHKPWHPAVRYQWALHSPKRYLMAYCTKALSQVCFENSQLLLQIAKQSRVLFSSSYD